MVGVKQEKGEVTGLPREGLEGASGWWRKCSVNGLGTAGRSRLTNIDTQAAE